VVDQQKQEEQKRKQEEAEASYVDQVLKLFDSMVLQNREVQNSKEAVEDLRIEEQATTMLKSIYAYWCVFSLRFVDNLH